MLLMDSDVKHNDKYDNNHKYDNKNDKRMQLNDLLALSQSKSYLIN